MNKIARKYYLPWLISMSIIFGINVLIMFISKLTSSQDYDLFDLIVRTIVVWVAVVLAITLWCGGIFHIWYEYFRPRRRLKMLSKDKLKELEKINFKINIENCCYSGVYKDYYMMITPDS